MRRAECGLALALLLGCAQVDVVAVRRHAASAGDAGTHHDAGRDAALTHDAAPPDTGQGRAGDARMPEPACDYRTQAVASGEALDAVLARMLSHGICSCEAIAVSGKLQTDAFDGALGAYVKGELGGDVAANGEMSLDTPSRVFGSLTIAGSSGLSLSPKVTLDVGRDLAVGGPFEGALATAHIAGNARVAGRIALESLSVGGELVQPAGGERSVTGTSDIHALRSAAVSVAAPCACSDPAVVQTAAARAVMVKGAAPVLAQRCGRFALAGATTGSLHVTAHESAALYVSGDLQVRGDLIVDTDPGAELDLFIESNATIDGVIALGSKPNQGAVRVFVGGAGTVQLTSGGALLGFLYAPHAELVLSAPLEVSGAIFVRRVAATANLTVHYDRNLTRR